MDALKLLLERASAVKLQDPGPTQGEVDTMLRCALRAPAYDGGVKMGLRLEQSDAIIGIIYVGTPAMSPREMARPQLADFVTHWQG
jgi:hypothetical protein